MHVLKQHVSFAVLLIYCRSSGHLSFKKKETPGQQGWFLSDVCKSERNGKGTSIKTGKKKKTETNFFKTLFARSSVGTRCLVHTIWDCLKIAYLRIPCLWRSWCPWGLPFATWGVSDWLRTPFWPKTFCVDGIGIPCKMPHTRWCPPL